MLPQSKKVSKGVMGADSKVAVVIPLYKEELDAFEIVSLKRCLEVLSSHDIVVVAPNKLRQSDIFGHYGLSNVTFIADKWLASIDAYNKLMLSRYFYQLFAEYEYILICQLDAYVFSDRLLEFCSLGYDYIGAPWIKGCPVRRFVYRGAGLANKAFPFLNPNYLLFVGNGGFSLRRVSSFITVIGKLRLNLMSWQRNEDAFWAYCGQRLSYFRVPPVEVAKDFAVEEGVDLASAARLPFGCHAWPKFHLQFIQAQLGPAGISGAP